MSVETALADRIVGLCKRDEIPLQFRASHVRNHFQGKYATNYINTVLANFAVGGDYVKRGQKARFKRVSRGLYELASGNEFAGQGSVSDPALPNGINADDLDRMRRELIKTLNCIEEKSSKQGETVGKRVTRLCQEGKVSGAIADWMHLILRLRNAAVYDDRRLSQNESKAITAAWTEIREWAASRAC